MLFKYNNETYRLILFTLAGSRFYGTYYDADDKDRIHPFKPEYKSDHDWRGVFVAHPDTKVGMTGGIEEIEIKKDKNGNINEDGRKLIDELNEKLGMSMEYDTDLNLYEIKKFVTLALVNNPNIFDILFTDDDAIRYVDDRGRRLIEDGKDVFLSTKTKFTFSGYAFSQLKRIKGHNKFIVKYPKTNIVIRELNRAFKNKEVDYNWITDYFGGRVSEFVSGVTQQDANEFEKMESVSWETFVETHSEEVDAEDVMIPSDWVNYRKPQLIDYCTPKDLKAKKLSMTDMVGVEGEGQMTVREFLLTRASFRSISRTQYNIFTPPNDKFRGGIFSRNGKLKAKDPKEVGDFRFQVSINDSNFKSDVDDIKNLWTWRTGRNEKRSVLEEHFGYDVKHASHLFRLLIGAKNILTDGEYQPRLSGDNLTLVLDILNGRKEYDWVVEQAYKMEEELNVLYKKSTLPKSSNHKKANALLLELSRAF